MFNLSTFWKVKNRYAFILKSGAEIYVKADDVVVTYNTSTLNIIGYNIKGHVGPVPIHIVPSEIAAVTKI